MKRFAMIVALSVGLAPTLFAGIAEARKAFECKYGEPFRHASLVDVEVAPASAVLDKAPGKATYRLALPYAEDARLRFVTADFDGGRFVAVQLHVLGFEPKSLTADEFARLRDGFPMVSVRMDSDEISPVAVFYPARGQRQEFAVADDWNLSFNPVALRLGTLGSSIGRLGLSADKLAYRVVLTGRDGLAVDLGVGTSKNRILDKTVLEKVREAIEARDPSRKGKVSDRDVVNWRHGSVISYKAEK